MAIPKTSLSDGQLRENFAIKCREWVRNAEKQKTRAKEMKKRAREMRDRAEEMARPPQYVIAP